MQTPHPRRKASIRNVFGLCVSLAVAALLVFGDAACGRSGLTDYLDFGLPDSGSATDATTGDGGAEAGKTDGGDSGPCSPSTCPTGCCTAEGVCQSGIGDEACGTHGGACVNCELDGGTSCEGTTHTCVAGNSGCGNGGVCEGCCGGIDGGTCLLGTDPTACGSGGASCTDCTASGNSCDADASACTTTATCGPDNCSGCCVGNVCVGGTADSTCGAAGGQCLDCSATGQQCTPTGSGGACTGSATCTAATCAGCCVGDVCLAGTANTACGGSAAACENCSASGDICTAAMTSGGVCSALCGPDNCTGCCQDNVCVAGSLATACGVNGGQCGTCGAAQTCTAGVCVGASKCTAKNCAGCCVGDTCMSGSADGDCGTGGAACTSCSALGDVCSKGACAEPPCGPSNCAGCCQAGVCQTGTSDVVCGTAGVACQNCDTLAEVCKTGACAAAPPPCTAANCASGCCDPQAGCLAGFVDTACGSGGGTCSDCTTSGSTCDTSVSPRVCTDQQTTCPAVYATCPATTAPTTAPAIAKVCTASELANAASACSIANGGISGTSCTQYFTFEATNDPACNSCLTNFQFDLNDKRGVYACVAPYVSPTCDGQTACETDCEGTSCAKCASASESSCLSAVNQGQCATYLTASESCTDAALNNPATGQFCNPTLYGGDFGAWLQGVAQTYCASGH